MDTRSPIQAERRLQSIELARRQVLVEGRGWPAPMLTPQRAWIERSWRRCLAAGLDPARQVEFDSVSVSQLRDSAERHHGLLQAARPVLDGLAHAIARTRYFALLTDADGVVIDVAGPVDHADRQAHAIARVGVDLSEPHVGTSAIGAALGEQHPVWLHRGEHFFADTAVYSCAGAPLFGADGRCVGMLDLTGVQTVERPELMHMAARAAQCIGNALVLAQPHALALRLNWPGQALGGEDDGLIALDAHGWIHAANPAARTMLPALALGDVAVHAEEVFAIDLGRLFDITRWSAASAAQPVDVALWSGLRVQAAAVDAASGTECVAAQAPGAALSLRAVEDALVRRAVDAAHGNVARAAKALGVSRATVYRKLGQRR